MIGKYGELVSPFWIICIFYVNIINSLWGDHGQSLLEAAQVCLITANALGTEILKGLILPGIGGFTVVDGDVVTEEDIGSK